MKSTSGILWYFFLIYATSVIVNFSHYHKTFASDNESVILNAAKCLIHGKNANNSNNNENCKLAFQYKKETVLYFLKSLLSRKEFNKAYKLTLKNGSKKGEIDLINITLDFKPLFNNEKNSPNADKFNFWYSFYILISILLITFLTPLWPLTNYIYLITLASMFIFSLTIYLQLIKLIVFSLIYLITLKKYKLWLLPNLNKDVGFLRSFWPLYELHSDNDSNNGISKLNNTKDSLEANPKDNNSKDDNSKDDSSKDQLIINRDEFKQTSIKQETSSNKLNEETSSDDCKLVNKSIKSKSITEFVGNDHLPTIITTIPASVQSCELANGKPNLEIIDLNNSEQELDKSEVREDEYVNDMKLKVNDYANITPTAISYLNVNQIRKRQCSPARSDDGFEILNNDFSKLSNTSINDERFYSSKQLNGCLTQKN